MPDGRRQARQIQRPHETWFVSCVQLVWLSLMNWRRLKEFTAVRQSGTVAGAGCVREKVGVVGRPEDFDPSTRRGGIHVGQGRP
jgi:hypothetical protein